MDETDMVLLHILWEDSRISFNKLSKIIGISGNILKTRADKLEQQGVFIYHTIPIFSQFGYRFVVFNLEIPRWRREYFISKISSNFEEVYYIIFTLSSKCGINVLFPLDSAKVTLDEHIENFKKRLHDKISELHITNHYNVAFISKNPSLELNPKEIMLIRLLNEHSRRNLEDLSEKIKLSKKTLSRYIQKLKKMKVIKHTIGVEFSKIQNFVIHILLIVFKTQQNLENNVKNLKKRLNWISYYAFNEPPGCGFFVYSETISEMENKVKELDGLPQIKSVEVIFPSSIVRLKKWKDLVLPISGNNKGE
ncbi:MAG: winged helix-turn-helix transcriptional regulator [Promethearchaeota archaeon]